MDIRKSKYLRVFVGSGIWMFVLLLFWNTLYGRVVGKAVTTEELFGFTSSSVGIQAPFLHAIAFLMIYQMLLAYFLSGGQIYQMYRMNRKHYGKNLIRNSWITAIWFVGSYSTVYTLCLWNKSSFLLLLKSSFFLSLICYSIILITFYHLFGIIFLWIACSMDGRWKSMLVTTGISVGCLWLFYFTRIPTPFLGMDVFDMVYYQHSILIVTYGRRVLLNLLLIFIAEYLLVRRIERKDVVGNEVL